MRAAGAYVRLSCDGGEQRVGGCEHGTSALCAGVRVDGRQNTVGAGHAAALAGRAGDRGAVPVVRCAGVDRRCVEGAAHAYTGDDEGGVVEDRCI